MPERLDCVHRTRIGRPYNDGLSGHSKWSDIKHKGTPETLDDARAELVAASSGQRVLTEAELVEGLIYTYGMSPGHAAELAASHFGHPHRCLPDDADLAIRSLRRVEAAVDLIR